MTPSDIIEVSLDRGSCFGLCPVFHFSASRHAGYRYHGRRYVEPLGERSGGMPEFLFDRLAGLCLELRVMELDDWYPSDFEDTPLMIITVKHRSGVKVVRHEGGHEMPLRLWALSELIEVIMRQVLREKT